MALRDEADWDESFEFGSIVYYNDREREERQCRNRRVADAQ